MKRMDMEISQTKGGCLREFITLVIAIGGFVIVVSGLVYLTGKSKVNKNKPVEMKQAIEIKMEGK